MQLNIPLVPRDPNGALRVLSIGRVSTEQQPIENIAASHSFVDTFLQSVYSGEIHVKRLGECASGMLIDRATIQEAISDIESETWDLVIAEDLSRIYRNPQYQFAFVHTCVDTDTRLICIGDSIDTADENWEVPMHTATLRHGLHGPDTRRRVKRTVSHSFKKGGMVQKIRFGYRKLIQDEAASGQFGPVGLRLAKLPEWTPTILQMRENFLAGWEYEEISDWLHYRAVPTGKYVKSKRWTAKLVKSLLQDDILWGLRTFRRVNFKRVLNGSSPSGSSARKFRRKKNPTPETEYCPTLAHMSKEEFDVLAAEIKRRELEHRCSPVTPSTRKNVRRSDSYWPAQHVCCSACLDKMHLIGNDQLKCRNAGHNAGECWNHVHVLGDYVRTEFITWLDGFLNQHVDLRALVVNLVWNVTQRTRDRSEQAINIAVRETERLEREQSNLIAAIKKGDELPVLVDELKAISSQLAKAKEDTKALSEQDTQTFSLLSRDKLDTGLKEVLMWLARTSYEFARIMRRMIPEFWIQPIQALDSGLVRPRAHLVIDFSRLLDFVNCRPNCILPDRPVELVLNLFTPPEHIGHLEQCVAAKREEPNKSLKKIAAGLKIGYMTVKRAIDYHRLMVAEGLSTPYRILIERPQNASRWIRRPESARVTQ